jgi:hypothetical protein
MTEQLNIQANGVIFAGKVRRYDVNTINASLSNLTDVSPSFELWRSLEERGDNLKESMFKVGTWILGFSAAVMGFAVKEGFVKGHLKVADPVFVIGLASAGLVILAYAALVLIYYGKHINRSFARADAALNGVTSPRQIWHAGETATGRALPAACWHLIIIVGIFAIGDIGLIYLALNKS